MLLAFCGSAGTGKSTLVEELLKLPQFKNYDRYLNVQRLLHGYLGDKFPHSSKTNNLSQISIYSNFLVQLLQAKNNNIDLICDRSLLDAFVYSELASGVTIAEELEDVFNKALELYDVIFYTPIEFKIENDGFRDIDENYVKECDNVLRKYIEKYKDKVKIVEVRGTIKERLDIITKTIEG